MAFAHRRDQLRRAMRRGRRRISAQQAVDAAAEVARYVSRLESFRNAEAIAAYQAIQGELDPRPLIELAWARGKTVYLPVVTGRDQALRFVRYLPETPLVTSELGIPEPASQANGAIEPMLLDLVLAPVVAFDSAGNRIGMGGGHYDRTFAFLLGKHAPARPVLLGLAFEMQRVDALPACRWDVPLAGVVTEAGLHLPASSV